MDDGAVGAAMNVPTKRQPIAVRVSEQTVIGCLDLLQARLPKGVLELLLNLEGEEFSRLLHCFLRLDLTSAFGTDQHVVRLRIGWAL